MIQVSINRTCARLQTTEPLTSGMIGKQMQLVFDSSWNGLRKTAVFSDGNVAVSLMDSFWGDSNTITIPHEVLTEAGRTVTMGVYGYTVNGDETILAIPSVYAELGKVRKGADPEADPTADPTLPVYAQLEWKIDHYEVPEGQIAEQVQEYLDEHPIEIQPATETVLGAVKVGDGLSVTPDGTLSADSIDAYTKAETDALLDGKQPSGDYATTQELDALADIVDGKADAADIPSLDGYATENWVESKGYLTQHQSLAAYRTAAAQDIIDNGKQDKLIAGANITIAADGKTISATGGGGGTSDHRQLTNRDAANQHPISAITGLQSTLDAKGTYSKPSGGIPKTDLASDVQTSLSRADTALQTHQSLAAYRTAAAQDVIDNGKQPLIADLASIRSGAALGATSVQPEAGKGLFSGNYNDLTNKPTIPTVNDAVLTIKQGGVTKGTFSANASSATEINLDAGGGGSDEVYIVHISLVNGAYHFAQGENWDAIYEALYDFDKVVVAELWDFDNDDTKYAYSFGGYTDIPAHGLDFVFFRAEGNQIRYLYVHRDNSISAEVVDLDDYALKSDLPQNVSELANDSGYLTLATLPIYGGEVV